MGHAFHRTCWNRFKGTLSREDEVHAGKERRAIDMGE